MEFRAKPGLSIDGNGMARLAYNEYGVLIGVIERYWERAGRYLERDLADKVYWNR